MKYTASQSTQNTKKSLVEQLSLTKINKKNPNKNDKLTITMHVKRDKHENGMTLKEYTDALIAGTQPILDHDMFVYQFGSIQDEIDLVVNWANTNNLVVKDCCCGKATVRVEGTVGQFNKLFSVSLYTATTDSRTYTTHDGTYTLPNEINDVIETITGLDNFVAFKSCARIGYSTTKPSNNSNIDSALILGNPSPVDLALAYKFPRILGTDAEQGEGECIGILELGGGWEHKAVNASFRRINLPSPEIVDVNVGAAFNDISDIGSSIEVLLDIYCAGAVAPAAKQVIYFAENSFQGFADGILAAANDTVNNPSSLSISWAGTDWIFEYYGFKPIFDAAIQACLVKGITVLVAAGDYGVIAIPYQSGPYAVCYPAASPYALACGGTEVVVDYPNRDIVSEIVWGTDGDFPNATGGGQAYPWMRDSGIVDGLDEIDFVIRYYGFEYQGTPVPDWQKNSD